MKINKIVWLSVWLDDPQEMEINLTRNFSVCLHFCCLHANMHRNHGTAMAICGFLVHEKLSEILMLCCGVLGRKQSDLKQLARSLKWDTALATVTRLENTLWNDRAKENERPHSIEERRRNKFTLFIENSETHWEHTHKTLISICFCWVREIHASLDSLITIVRHPDT